MTFPAKFYNSIEKSSLNSKGSMRTCGGLGAASKVLPKGSSARTITRHQDDRLIACETAREASESNISMFGSSNQLSSSLSSGFSLSLLSDFEKN